MSYSIHRKLPGRNRSQHLASPTYNYFDMTQEAGFNFHDLHQLRGAAAARRLAEVLALLEADPLRFLQHNPPNGWGSYHQLLPLLSRLIEDFQQHPTSTITVD